MAIVILNTKESQDGEYMGRGSVLGNPFPITDYADRDKVCDQYANVFAQWIEDKDPVIMRELQRLLDMYEQQGTLSLRCFCAPKRCHAETVRDWLYDNAFQSDNNF